MKNKGKILKLSKRELEIVDLISEGLSDKEIMLKLKITYGTLRSHVDKIFLKTRSDGRIKMLNNLHYIKKPDDVQQIARLL